MIDGVLCALVAVLAYHAAHQTLAASYRIAPAIEDLFVPCTGRPGWAPDLTALHALPQWTAFVDRKIEYFPCDALKGISFSEIGVLWDLQKYFHVMLSAWFRVVGPTVEGFLTFQSASYSVTCVLAFLIFRLGMGRIVALVCAAGFVWSAPHLSVVGLPIEYAKAPWVLAVVWLCGVMVTRDTAGRPVRWAALFAGLAAGVGIGFKGDLIAVAPLAVLTALLFVGARGDRLRAVTAALLVIAGIAIGGGTMLYRNFFGPTASVLPVQVIGGQDFETESLYASRPTYDYGVSFDDPYVTWMINSYGHRVLGTTTNSGFYLRQMQDVSSRMLADLWTTFPADLVLRVIAAAVRVVRLNEMSPYVAAAGLFLVLARNRRQGWFVVTAFLYLSAYVSLIFQYRHIFHLEFIAWFLWGVVAQCVLLVVIAIARAGWDWRLPALLAEAPRRWTRPALGAAFSLAVVAAIGASVLLAARQYQQARVVRLVDRYQQMPRDPRPTMASEAGSGEVALHVDGQGLADRDASPETSTSDYLVVALRGQASGDVMIKSRFLPPVPPESRWNRDFRVPCAGAGTESTFMTPIYQYGTAYRFDRLLISRLDSPGVLSVSTLRADRRVGLWLNLFLPADWKTRRWFETMKSPPAMPAIPEPEVPAAVSRTIRGARWWRPILGARFPGI